MHAEAIDTVTHQLLVRLSRLDRELHDLDHQIQVVPDRVARLEARRAALEAALRGLEEERRQLVAGRREQEATAETLRAQIAGYEKQLLGLKSNTDYQTMLHQIEDARARLGRCDDQVLELMEREEELGERLSGERARVADQVEGAAEEMQALHDERARLEERRRARQGERAAAVDGLLAGLRRLYERVHGGKQGIAIVPVMKEACGGCFSALPPQQVNEAQLGSRLVTCETCGRIVVWDAELSSR